MNSSANVPTEFYILVNHLWQSTVIALLVWGLALSLKKHSANLRYRLWMLASAKFLVPLSFLISLGNTLRSALAHTSSVAIPQVSEGIVRSMQPYAISARTITAPAIPSANTPGVFWIACVLLWGSGAFVVTGLWLRAWLGLYRIARNGQPCGEVAGIPVLLCNEVSEPGVFGIINLCILLPEELLTRISELELDTIYAHELCHVRRRDNLIAALHAVVHSLFWFHPAVWLIRSRLMDERERACDEMVLASGVDTETYARSIVNVCKYYVEAPEGVMSGVTGGSLKHRVQRILANISYEPLSPARKLVIAICIVSVAVLPVCLGLMNMPQVLAQSENRQAGTQTRATGPLTFDTARLKQRPSFEVAVVRAHDPNDRDNFNRFQAYPGGRFTSTNTSLWMLIHYAFQVQPYQIPSKPQWIKSLGYDLNAKPGEVHGFDDIPVMLQGLLEDRFQLKYHWEILDQPVYDLVVTEKGKLRESIVKAECPRPFSNPDGVPKDAPCGDLSNTSGYTKGYKLTGDELATSLSWLLSKPVVDKTNLAGAYDVELRWTPESVAMQSNASPDPDAPGIFTAIHEQLGLKLQPARGPVRVLVIDHVEKPSDN